MTTAAATILCAAAGTILLVTGLTRPGPPPQTPAAAGPRPSGVPPSNRSSEPPTGPTTGTTLPRARPLSLTAPAINLRTEKLASLGRMPDGALETPQEWDTVGWYERGPWPGQPGPAVLVGHVDSTSGPAVFFRLGELRPHDRVTVRRADGRAAVFTVYAVASYAKDDFPTSKVYGNVDGRAELRLITCGGSFDTRTRHYRSNIVVYAKLTGTRPASVQVE